MNSVTDPASTFSEGRRSLLSLLILLHLFCVFVGMFGNESNSRLSLELRRVLGPYLRTANLDPQFPTSFQLTHAMDFEDDHHWSVESTDGTVLGVWPAITPSLFDRVDFRLRRWQTLARRTTHLASDENDTSIAELARGIATSYFADSDAKQLVLRCRRFQPTSWEEPLPNDVEDSNSRFTEIYVADAMRDSSGVVRVLKRVEKNEAAQVRGALQPHRPAPKSAQP